MATPADFARIGNYARIYNPDQGIDRRKARRTVPMELLCLGNSRTGTLSMRRAAEILGYPDPYHYSNVLDSVSDCDMWIEALRAKFHGEGEMPDKKFFDGLLGHCGAVTDTPCISFARELVEFYPDAKVVLVERDIESWYTSWLGFCEGAYSKVVWFSSRLDPGWAKKVADAGLLSARPVAGHALTMGEVRARSKDAYRHYYRDVREMVPKERLLEFQLKDGWEPLCKFLSKPVPVSVCKFRVGLYLRYCRTYPSLMRMTKRQTPSSSLSLRGSPKDAY